ncbi:MAG: phosphate signaling complex protein PhoU [Rhizobiaceae bacterium]|jgi:phosphate transport system protein|nr:phosphate signaling complex protein PhoU [Rhizobiaceae bacterium]
MSDISHTVTAYDDELRFLSDRIAEMGGHAERMVDRAVTALIKGDHGLSRTIIADDAILDRWEREVVDKAILVIAKRQPMAKDLREIVGTMRIASDLERIGDLGKNIAKRTVAVSEVKQPLRLYRGVEALAELALLQLKEVLDIFANRKVEDITVLRDRDEDIDAKYTSLFRELLTYMMEDPRNISACTHLLFCAKNIERIGDHVTNIAETIHYMVTGLELKGERPKDDQHNAVVVAAK